MFEATKKILAVCVASVMLAFGNIAMVLAAAPYLASNIFGQSTGGAPDFDTDDINDVDVNDHGLSSPGGVVVDDTLHKLFVADSANNRVLVHNLDSSDNIIDRTADNVIGQTNLTSGNSGATQSTLNSPWGLAIDKTNTRLFVADMANHRVLVFDYSSVSNGMNAAYVLGQADFTSSSSATTQSRLNQPRDLIYDGSASFLYVGDRLNSRVMVFNVSSISNGENAANVLGQPNYTATCPCTTSATTMAWPTGLAFDSSGGRLFVGNGGVDRVTVYDVNSITNGEAAVNVLGISVFNLNGSSSATATTTPSPIGLAYDPGTSNLFVGSTSPARISVFSVAAISNGEAAVNVLGATDLTSHGISGASQASLGTGSKTMFMLGSRLYVSQSSNNRVSIFDVSTVTNGEDAVDMFGQTNSDESLNYGLSNPNNATASQTGLYRPWDVALDETGHRLFAVDYSNNRVIVHQLDQHNHYVDNAADFVLGQSNFISSGSSLSQNSFNQVTAVEYDAGRDWLFVADDARILVFDVASITNGEAAIHVLGEPDYTSYSDDFTQTDLSYVSSMAYDEERHLLFAADFLRIMVFDVASITNGEAAVNVIGQPDFTTTDWGLTASQFNFPDFVAFDPVSKMLYASDFFQYRILVFDTTSVTDGMDASYVLGASDFTTEGDGGPSATGIGLSEGMEVDTENRRLFVIDGNLRVMVFDVASLSNGEAAVGVIGSTAFDQSDEYYLGREYVEDSGAVAYNSAGNSIFVANPYTNRLVEFEFVRLIGNAALPVATTGQAYNSSLGTEGDQGTLSFALSSGSLPTGLSLSSGGVVSGTPTQTGNFTFSVTVSDDNGDAGTYEDTKEYTLLSISNDVDGDGQVNASDPDDDGDEIPDTVENAAPNSGDANNDSIPDIYQSDVSSVVNDVTNEYITLDTTGSSTSCDVVSFTVDDEDDLAVQDNSADYPIGLNDFTVTCANPGDTADVRVIYQSLYDTSNWVYRKYDSAANNYVDMTNDVTFGTASIDGNTVTTVEYSVTDGGRYDQDGTANGTIVDPAGPAVLGASSLANTGASIALGTLTGAGILGAAWAARTKRHRLYKIVGRR